MLVLRALTGDYYSVAIEPQTRSRRSGEWNEDDFDVLADGAVVGPYLQGHP